jgi:ribosomal protein S18 acetylase RimI-like enzyme
MTIGDRAIQRYNDSMGSSESSVRVRNTEPRDFAAMGDLCRRVYPETRPWRPEELASHRQVFPEGQFVAVYGAVEQVVGMAANLIVHWDDYNTLDSWQEFTANGMFINHDPVHGHTMYGAEVIVDPTLQGHGIGHKLYAARQALVEQLRLRRTRGGSRLRGYHQYAHEMSPNEYVVAVVHGLLTDPTLTFQLNQGFHVIAVAPHYLEDDPESRGFAAVIEWLNPQVILPEHYADRPTQFLHRSVIESAGR